MEVLLQGEANFYAGRVERIHLAGCPEGLWAYNEAGEVRLITASELDQDRDNCPACWAEWEAIDKVVEQCGEAFYYDLAIRAMHELRMVELYHLTLNDLTAVQVEMIDAADRAISMRRKQLDYIQYRNSQK
jgi:hypothetical protein